MDHFTVVGLVPYHYYQYTRPNLTNLFPKERLFNLKSCCQLQIPFTAHTLPFNWHVKRSVLDAGDTGVITTSLHTNVFKILSSI